MRLELILGPMFAGKSSAILARVRRAEALGWKHLVITCAIDTRYDAGGCQIKTHDHAGMEALGVKVLEGMRERAEYRDARLIVVEEGQFFPDLVDFVVAAVESDGKDVLVVGLDGDSDRKPFGQILKLVPLADDVIRLSALCKRCGDGTEARFSAYVAAVQKGGQVSVGAADRYEPMCRLHYLENRELKAKN